MKLGSCARAFALWKTKSNRQRLKTRLSSNHGANVRPRRLAERAQVVSAFETLNDSAPASCCSRLFQPPGHPLITRVVEQKLSERIGFVGVEAGRDEYEIGREVLHRRFKSFLEQSQVIFGRRHR